MIDEETPDPPQDFSDVEAGEDDAPDQPSEGDLVLVSDPDEEDTLIEETVISVQDFDESSDMWRVVTEGGQRKVYYDPVEQSWVHSEES